MTRPHTADLGQSADAPTDSAREPLVRIQHLSKNYVQHRPISRAKFHVTALEDASLDIQRGETLALIGDSGSGKSTLARCLALLEKPSAGEIWFDRRDLSKLTPSDLFAVRSQIQMIFQDPASALNPRMTALEIATEPLTVQKSGTKTEQRERALEWMARVGLPAGSERKRPMEFSGGQRQRLAIARALTLAPKLLILDEALSSLDLANQEMISRLLADLQREHALTYLHISHDLQLVANLADEIAVMHEGKVVEQQPAAQLLAEPRHPYTRDLLLAMPSLESIVLDRSA
jgi:peptide/nickel transport system ATP-binding protein/oligopeptide transport system ATP-binding protein